jgi:single-stranded DNA-specific DHH superfamily exonuclease
MKKYLEFIKEEVGLRNLKKITKDIKNCEIYFHKDLDGVTSAIAMKEFLKNYYQIEAVDCHIIQYGGLEFAIKHHQPGNLPVLVDFAHSKPMFTIATDHHDKQVGGEDTDSTYFKSARSNVETISGEISYSDIFTSDDIKGTKSNIISI